MRMLCRLRLKRATSACFADASASGRVLFASSLADLWKGVVRTSGSYAAQHARHLATVASRVGERPPSLILIAMGTYDSQWQNVHEVSHRLEGLFEGITQRWPVASAGSPLVAFLGPSSCAPNRHQYSVHMGHSTRHNHFHNMDNASALIPFARRAAANRSVLYVDPSPLQMSVPPLRSSPCHYDLPLGITVEALVQVTISGLVAAAQATAAV